MRIILFISLLFSFQLGLTKTDDLFLSNLINKSTYLSSEQKTQIDKMLSHIRKITYMKNVSNGGAMINTTYTDLIIDVKYKSNNPIVRYNLLATLLHESIHFKDLISHQVSFNGDKDNLDNQYNRFNTEYNAYLAQMKFQSLIANKDNRYKELYCIDSKTGKQIKSLETIAIYRGDILEFSVWAGM